MLVLILFVRLWSSYIMFRRGRHGCGRLLFLDLVRTNVRCAVNSDEGLRLLLGQIFEFLDTCGDFTAIRVVFNGCLDLPRSFAAAYIWLYN